MNIIARLKSAENGYFIEFVNEDGEYEESYVIQETPNSIQNFKALQAFLYMLAGRICSASKYSDARIQISVVPGENHETFEMCSHCDQVIPVDELAAFKAKGESCERGTS